MFIQYQRLSFILHRENPNLLEIIMEEEERLGSR